MVRCRYDRPSTTVYADRRSEVPRMMEKHDSWELRGRELSLKSGEGRARPFDPHRYKIGLAESPSSKGCLTEEKIVGSLWHDVRCVQCDVIVNLY